MPYPNALFVQISADKSLLSSAKSFSPNMKNRNGNPKRFINQAALSLSFWKQNDVLREAACVQNAIATCLPAELACSGQVAHYSARNRSCWKGQQVRIHLFLCGSWRAALRCLPGTHPILKDQARCLPIPHLLCDQGSIPCQNINRRVCLYPPHRSQFHCWVSKNHRWARP